MAISLFRKTPDESKSDHDDLSRDTASRAALDALAVEAEGRLRADQPDLLAQFEAELERQRAGFSVEFKRHGDFLTLFLERLGNKGTAQTRHSETINLGQVKSIELFDGSAPDLKGSFGWRWQEVYRNAKGEVIGSGSGTGYPLLPFGDGIEVTPHGSPEHVPHQRAFVEYEKQDKSGAAYWCGSEGVSHYTRSFPRKSNDDVIRFRGIGLSLFAPFGLGATVHAHLIAEIERGAPSAP